MFKAGDRVRYKGRETGFLVRQEGTVLEESPNGSVKLTSYPYDSLPVLWDGKGYYGVYKHNAEIIQNQPPAWEV